MRVTMKSDHLNDIQLPESRKLTIAWLKQHVPVAWWWAFVVFIITIFGFGLAVGNWEPISWWMSYHLGNQQIRPAKQGSQSPDAADSSRKKSSKPTKTNPQQPDILKNLKEIREIVNCRIDLSTEMTFQLPEHGTDTKHKLAEIQAKSERTAVVRKLLNEIDRVTMQVAQILGKQHVMKMGPFPIVWRQEICRK